MAKIRKLAYGSSREMGDKGEGIACGYLKNLGFIIEYRNYQKVWGELDIIAVKDSVIHFFEVKSVSVSHFDKNYRGKFSHPPEENVHNLKVRHIRRMVQTYLEETNRGMECEFQFHVLCVYMDNVSRRARIKWIKNIIL